MIDYNKLSVENQDLIYDLVCGACVDINNNLTYSLDHKEGEGVFKAVGTLFGMDVLKQLVDKARNEI